MNLDELRKKIDALDEQIIEFLNERTDVVLQVGKEKLSNDAEIYSPSRESQVYARIDKINKGPLPSDALKSIYREIMSAALSLEKHLKIAYLGPEATYTHLASLSKFGNAIEYVGCDSISGVFDEVDKRRADYGVVPIENSFEGAVNHTLDMFVDSDLKICNEIFLPINHNLMAQCDMGSIKRIYSNPQVFGQCRMWLKTHLPKAELIDTASTTVAAQRAGREQGAAAIASRLASVIYNLDVLAESIEDSANNVTRFLVVGKSLAEPSGTDKTSIVCSIKDKVGALFEMLEPINTNNINMTKIESRPSKKKAWDYYFFIDLLGHASDPEVAKTIKEVEERVRYLKVLGSYPRQS